MDPFPNMAGKLTAQLLDSCAYLASIGIAHCDIKAGNICIADEAGRVFKLIDFGSAVMAGDVHVSYVQSRPGRAPEVMLGMLWDSKVDVWYASACGSPTLDAQPSTPQPSPHPNHIQRDRPPSERDRPPSGFGRSLGCLVAELVLGDLDLRVAHVDEHHALRRGRRDLLPLRRHRERHCVGVEGGVEGQVGCRGLGCCSSKSDPSWIRLLNDTRCSTL